MLPAVGQPEASLRPTQHGQTFTDTKPADHAPASACLKASYIIGLEVRNAADERLGKVQDLIVSLDSQSAPIAILTYGGALGIGETRVAVPLKDLRWSSTARQLTMAATRSELETASPFPTGGWAAITHEDWTKNIDHYYDQPSGLGQSRFERQEMSGATESREPVREALQPKDASSVGIQAPGDNQEAKQLLAQPTEVDLMMKVNEIIGGDLGSGARDVQATVANGVVTLKGKVANDTQKGRLETQIKALTGVNRVENQLVTGSE